SASPLLLLFRAFLCLLWPSPSCCEGVMSFTRLPPRAALLVAALLALPAAAQQGYQKPPKAIAGILDAPPTPAVLPGPGRDYLLAVRAERHPPIAALARPFLRLGGLRINPRTNGPRLPPLNRGLAVLDAASGKERPVKLPAGARVGPPAWSADGKRFAFTSTTEPAVELRV